MAGNEQAFTQVPDRVTAPQISDYDALTHIGMLAMVGVIVGMGQLLASAEQLTTRIVVGRALSSAGMGAVAAAVLAWLPDLPVVAQFGLAAGLASLGTSALEKIVQRLVGVGPK